MLPVVVMATVPTELLMVWCLAVIVLGCLWLLVVRHLEIIGVSLSSIWTLFGLDSFIICGSILWHCKLMMVSMLTEWVTMELIGTMGVPDKVLATCFVVVPIDLGRQSVQLSLVHLVLLCQELDLL